MRASLFVMNTSVFVVERDKSFVGDVYIRSSPADVPFVGVLVVWGWFVGVVVSV